MTAEAETAIDAWARWTRGEESRGACTSPAWLMMQAKQVGIAPRGTAPLPDMPDNVLKVDQAVAKLTKSLARVFKTYYLQYAPAAEKAARCGLRGNVRKFYRLVQRAKLFVVGEFSRIRTIRPFQPVTTFAIYGAHCGFVPPRRPPAVLRS